MMAKEGFPSNFCQKIHGGQGNVGTRRLVFTGIQAGNYDFSSGDDDGYYVYIGTG